MQNDNNIDLTDAERAEVDAEAKPVEAAAPAAAPAQAATPAPEAVDPNAEMRSLANSAIAAANSAATAASAAAAAAAAATPKQEAPAPVVPAEPDWNAERAALKARHEAGDLDDDAYDAAREALIERKFEHKTNARVEETIQKRMQESEEQRAERAWNTSWAQFQQSAENAAFIADPVRATAFNAVLQAVAQEGAAQTFDEMLAVAMDRSRTAFGLKPINDPQAAIAAAVAKREAEKPRPPGTLEGAPLAGLPGAGANDADARLDAMGVNDLEDALARMKPEDVEAYLARAPGGLRDNPRAE